MRQFRFNRDGAALAGVDFETEGRGVLLLLGLAGYGGEWGPTAEQLSNCARVVTLDARGHGSSETQPRDLSLEALVVVEADPVAADADSLRDSKQAGRGAERVQRLAGLVAYPSSSEGETGQCAG